MNEDPQFWNRRALIRANMATWLTVHGNLCLALRHPKNKGVSRQLAIAFVKDLGRFLVDTKAITATELKEMQKIEIEAGSPEFKE